MITQLQAWDQPPVGDRSDARVREASTVDAVDLGWPLAVLLALLALAAAGVVRLSGLGSWRTPLTAAARAVVQLGVVSLVIRFVLDSMAWTTAFLALMVAVAAGTAARRVTGSLRPAAGWLLLPILAGVLPTVGLCLASTVVPLEPVAVLPVVGILVGGAMTATTLAGRRTAEELDGHYGAYEAALSLGLPRRAAVGVVARPAAALALVPGQDQTRTVGLVTLPGAFVGVLLAGASPVEAGAAQVLVLVALLAVQSVAAAVTVELLAGGRLPVRGVPLPQ